MARVKFVKFLCAMLCALFLGANMGAEEPPAAAAVEQALPSVAEARRQAEVLHEAMHLTLQIVHHRYYREDEGLPIPAATLADVFRELEKEKQVKLRWLVVEGQAMNNDHKARDEFEIRAAEALRTGKGELEQVEKGVYRRAGPIALTNHCLKCHLPDRKSTATRTAGLIVSIPVQAK
jgi:hypothetical protein